MVASSQRLPVSPPTPNDDTRSFWEATNAGRLVVQRCRACRSVIWWPRAICPDCASFDLEEFDSSGRGVVYSYSVVHRGVGDWADVTPYVVALVELDEGPRMLTNIVDCDSAEVAVGTAVEVVWHDTGAGSALPRFTPS